MNLQKPRKIPEVNSKVQVVQIGVTGMRTTAHQLPSPLQMKGKALGKVDPIFIQAPLPKRQPTSKVGIPARRVPGIRPQVRQLVPSGGTTSVPLSLPQRGSNQTQPNYLSVFDQKTGIKYLSLVRGGQVGRYFFPLQYVNPRGGASGGSGNIGNGSKAVPIQKLMASPRPHASPSMVNPTTFHMPKPTIKETEPIFKPGTKPQGIQSVGTNRPPHLYFPSSFPGVNMKEIMTVSQGKIKPFNPPNLRPNLMANRGGIKNPATIQVRARQIPVQLPRKGPALTAKVVAKPTPAPKSRAGSLMVKIPKPKPKPKTKKKPKSRKKKAGARKPKKKRATTKKTRRKKTTTKKTSRKRKPKKKNPEEVEEVKEEEGEWMPAFVQPIVEDFLSFDIPYDDLLNKRPLTEIPPEARTKFTLEVETEDEIKRRQRAEEKAFMKFVIDDTVPIHDEQKFNPLEEDFPDAKLTEKEAWEKITGEKRKRLELPYVFDETDEDMRESIRFEKSCEEDEHDYLLNDEYSYLKRRKYKDDHRDENHEAFTRPFPWTIPDSYNNSPSPSMMMKQIERTKEHEDLEYKLGLTSEQLNNAIAKVPFAWDVLPQSPYNFRV